MSSFLAQSAFYSFFPFFPPHALRTEQEKTEYVGIKYVWEKQRENFFRHFFRFELFNLQIFCVRNLCAKYIDVGSVNVESMVEFFHNDTK